MSPENNFYNEENLERQSIAQDIRHNYGFIFSQITQLFEFYYPEQNKKLSKRAEDIETRIQILKKDEKISEYLYSNFFVVYAQYPSLLPGNLKKEKETSGEKKQFERLRKLKDLLILYIGDLADEISDVVNEAIEYDKKTLIRDYFAK